MKIFILNFFIFLVIFFSNYFLFADQVKFKVRSLLNFFFKYSKFSSVYSINFFLNYVLREKKINTLIFIQSMVKKMNIYLILVFI